MLLSYYAIKPTSILRNRQYVIDGPAVFCHGVPQQSQLGPQRYHLEALGLQTQYMTFEKSLYGRHPVASLRHAEIGIVFLDC
jgi:hypothetical protein